MASLSSSCSQALNSQHVYQPGIVHRTCRIPSTKAFQPALPASSASVRQLPYRPSRNAEHTSPRFRTPLRTYSASAAASPGAQPSPGSPSSPPSSPAAPNPFLTVLLPTSLALLLCNMDRICLSVAILPMAAEFGWPASLQGVVQSAFLWGYMATQLAGGALADRHGGKRVMAGGMAWFSAASLLLPLLLTPATRAAGLTVPAVLLARFLTGFGEGVALPCMSNLVAAHVPPAAKARALGMCFSGFHSGNLAGLILSPLLLACCGWRGLFYVFGALGLPLLLMWMKVVPDRPPPTPTPPQPALQQPAPAATASQPQPTMTQPSASLAPSSSAAAASSDAAAAAATTSPAGPQEQERAASSAAAGPGPGSTPTPATPTPATPTRTPDVSAARMLSCSATWAIIVVNVVNHFGYFIYLNWMPTYFNKALGFDLRASSFTAFLPWLVMAIGSSAAGLLADSLVARGVSVTAVRKTLQTIALLVPAAALLLLAQPGISPATAVACMTVALGTTSLGQAGFVANMSDVAPRHAGKMFGLCNTFGCAAGIAGVTAVGFIVEATHSFAPVFLLTAGLYVVGALAWNVWCTTERVF